VTMHHYGTGSSRPAGGILSHHGHLRPKMLSGLFNQAGE
jgi:hypothetical protein